MKRTLRNRSVAALLEAEIFWRRRRTIADNKLAEIHAAMRTKLAGLEKSVEVVKDAIKTSASAPTPTVKRGSKRKFDLK